MLNTRALIAIIISCAIPYLLGSINFAIIISRLFAKDDVRKHGSGSAGMTNMLRTYGKWPAVLTAAGDFLKAVLSVSLPRLMRGYLEGIPVDIAYIAGIFVIIGHLYPIYFGFKGGKGVMSALGVLITVNPVIFLMVTASSIPLVFITRIISIASIAGALSFAANTAAWAFLFAEYPWYYCICSAVICALIIYVHRANIKRLVNGTENRLGQKKKD